MPVDRREAEFEAYLRWLEEPERRTMHDLVGAALWYFTIALGVAAGVTLAVLPGIALIFGWNIK